MPGSQNAPSGRCVAFEKLDGTNLRWVWDRDFGWHAFGTRRDEFNLLPDGVAGFHTAHPGLDDAVAIFLRDLAEPKGGAGGNDVWMFKVKTYAYLERLKASFGSRWEDYWE